MAGGGEGNVRELDQTPTWAVAGVCAAIIVISIFLEKFLHKVGTWLTERHKKALYEALEKVKTELMILGFISLLLVFSQTYVAQICVPVGVAESMLPCPVEKDAEHRRLIGYERRHLAVGATEPSCEEGRIQLISIDGLHQLHILIFFLAIFHVVYSAVTMTLGKLKIRSWKEWEGETSSHHYEQSYDSSRFRLTKETSFVRTHTSFWTKIPFFFYIGCFFRQFFRSVSKSDYLTLRHGFIAVHLAPGSKFNFQKYIKRSLEDDFKTVVGVSPVLWGSFVVFLLLNVNGWRAMIWGSLVPITVILAVGTKLQVILTKMAVEITDKHAVVQGMPLVQASDELFWFGRPQLVLHLIHFALFQNSFQIVYSLWLWYEFRKLSCFHDNMKLVFIKPALGVAVLVLCSYITLPLYALIAQMGSQMKKTIFDEQTSKALKKWHMAVKKKKVAKSPGRSLDDSSLPASVASTLKATRSVLHRFKSTGHYEAFDLETDDPTVSITRRDSLVVTVDHHTENDLLDHPPHNDQEMRNADDLSFSHLPVQR